MARDEICAGIKMQSTGPLKPEVTVKYVSVMAIFLCSGMSMKTEVILMHGINN